MITAKGRPYPLGATVYQDGVNFAVFSKNATSLQLLLFDYPDDADPSYVFELDPDYNKTFYYWHIFIQGIKHGQLYGYRVQGPYQPKAGHRFNGNKVLIDPYSKSIACEPHWSRAQAHGFGDNCANAMKSIVIDPKTYDWEDDEPLSRPFNETIIYEMHVGGFTRHPSAGVDHPGTYAGVTEKIPYLRELGVTAVELMPVQQFDAQDIGQQHSPDGQRLTNHWGYAPVGFFAPHGDYCVSQDPAKYVDEFRDMVKALHRAGIEVILDVVFNHTAEGSHSGPTICFKGFENRAYYLLQRDRRFYHNFSGCGNTLDCSHSIVRRMIRECLRYWVQEMHVDGFRFDLASVMSRDKNGEPMLDPPIVWGIESDPVLAGSKLIAEAWDAGGLYQVGSFAGERWAEWDGRYRDDVRRFVKSDDGLAWALAARIAGSPHETDMSEGWKSPTYWNINFVTCHDGFTLNDLVSYNQKYNLANGEDNRDGMNDNNNWNCGVEGPTDDPEVEKLRKRQIKNFMTILLLSQGTPMLLAGDEMRRTQGGNNNAYCQDNEISWLDWRLLGEHADIFKFCQALIQIRRQNPVLQRDWFIQGLQTKPDSVIVSWHGVHLNQPDWGENSHSLAFTLQAPVNEHCFHVMLNVYWQPLTFELPPLGLGQRWFRKVDTWLDWPNDVLKQGEEVLLPTQTYIVRPRSVAVVVSQPTH